MQHQKLPAVGRLVNRLVHHFHARDRTSAIDPQHFIVISRHVDDARARVDLAQKRLDDAVVGVGPVPAAFQRQPSTMSPTRNSVSQLLRTRTYYSLPLPPIRFVPW